MKFSSEDDFRSACWGDPPEGFEFVEEVVVDSGRWLTDITTVFKHTESGEYWAIEWHRANTERQEQYDDQVASAILAYVRSNVSEKAELNPVSLICISRVPKGDHHY